MRKRTLLNLVMPSLLVLPALAFLACEDSDPVAIEGSTITVTAQPNPVAPGAISVVTARVTTSTGVPQQDTLIVFSSTNGTVTPETDLTDSEGRAFTDFAGPAGTATVTARSGGITGQINITISSTPPAQIQFTSTTADRQINSCDEDIELTGQVVTSSGGPSAGVLVEFDVISTTPSCSSTECTFTPVSVLTDASGNFTQTVSFRLSNSMCTTCSSQSCTFELQASSGTVQSNLVTVTESL